MAKKKKTRGPKKAGAQKPRRRPLGRGSGPVAQEQGGHWHGDQWHSGSHDHAGHGDHGDDPELAARLALIDEVEAIPEDDVRAALLANPLVEHLGAVLLSGADADTDPVVAAPEPPLSEAEVAVLARWSRAALLLETRQEADELAEEWREGGIAQTIAARAALSQYLSAVVAEGAESSTAEPAPSGAAFGVTPAAADEEADEPADARGELLVGVVGNLALTAEVDLADAPEGPARDAVRHDLRLLAAAGFLTLDGDVATVQPDLRNVLLAIADELVEALYGPEEGSLDEDDEERAPVA